MQKPAPGRDDELVLERQRRRAGAALSRARAGDMGRLYPRNPDDTPRENAEEPFTRLACTRTFVLFRLNTLPGPFSQLPTAEAPEALIRKYKVLSYFRTKVLSYFRTFVLRVRVHVGLRVEQCQRQFMKATSFSLSPPTTPVARMIIRYFPALQNFALLC